MACAWTVQEKEGAVEGSRGARQSRRINGWLPGKEYFSEMP